MTSKILLVEDDIRIAEVAVAYLEWACYRQGFENTSVAKSQRIGDRITGHARHRG